MKKMYMFLIFLIIMSLIACADSEIIDEEISDIDLNYQIVSVFRVEDSFLKNDRTFIIIDSVEKYWEMNVNNASNKHFSASFFNQSSLVIVNVAKSQGVELITANFRVSKTKLYVDLSLSVLYTFAFDGFGILIELPDLKVNQVIISEVANQ